MNTIKRLCSCIKTNVVGPQYYPDCPICNGRGYITKGGTVVKRGVDIYYTRLGYGPFISLHPLAIRQR